jgi:squalene-hopene/tetraprenyl-beta-curcumene cyclase
MARFLGWSVCGFALLVSLYQPAADGAGTSSAERIDHALVAGADYLIARQAPDGAWRSATYGAFKEGDALTPLAVRALLCTPPSRRRDAACRQGTAYLAALARSDGTIAGGTYGLTYPVYTAATTVMVLRESGHHHAWEAWLTLLRQHQLTEAQGWQPTDRQYGGWGYAKDLPRKPAPGLPIPTLMEPNLSATTFAVEALRSTGVGPDDPALRKARAFIERCQNFAESPASEDAPFEDGGFFFIHEDAIRNKAGLAGTDRAGRPRYFSYGSTTADGLNTLLACGLPRKHPRVVAARRWLETHFRSDLHPGSYASDRESARPALTYYYCSSVARAFQAAGVKGSLRPTESTSWAEQLADALLKRQRPDGSWSNPAVEVREDDPVVATSLAVQALATCRECLDAR